MSSSFCSLSSYQRTSPEHKKRNTVTEKSNNNISMLFATCSSTAVLFAVLTINNEQQTSSRASKFLTIVCENRIKGVKTNSLNCSW